MVILLEDSPHPLSVESRTVPVNGRCDHCSKFFLSKIGLESHMIDKHKTTENRECFLCDEIVRDGVNGYYNVLWGQYVGGHVSPICYTCRENE